MVLPLLLLLFAGIVDFGLMFQRYEVLTNAAREGARLASLPSYTVDTTISEHVLNYMAAGLGADRNTLAVTTTVDRTGTLSGAPVVRVTVDFDSDFIILGPIMRLFSGGDWTTLTLRAESVMRCEAGDTCSATPAP